MFDSDGNQTWSVDYDIYGKIRKQDIGNAIDCPFRYQGQYEDEETGFYYNRFRYYEPQVGLYLSKDPIGMLGGTALYEYVNDTCSGTDPLGLLTYNTMPSIPNYQKQHVIPQALKNHPAITQAGMNIHDSSNVKYLPKAQGIDPNPNLSIHNGSHPMYTQAVKNDLDQLVKNGKVTQQELDTVINKYSTLLDTGKIKCK